MSSLLIGLCTHEMDLPYLKETLPVLEELREKTQATMVVVDNSWSDELKVLFEKEYPQMHYLRAPGGNIGYGAVYNHILKEFPGSEFFLVTTSDVLISIPGLMQVFEQMKSDPELAMASGKLYFWDFPQLKTTSQIDTLGIWVLKKHHFYDLGQGEEDQGQHDSKLDKDEIFGISGASFLIRTSVIPELHGAPDILIDPGMWMYKEDIDLSYRLRWLGKKIKIFKVCMGWHARTAPGLGLKTGDLIRAAKSKRAYAREHSYKNHFRLLKNNFSFGLGLGVFFRILGYEFLKGGYMLFTHPMVFFGALKSLLFVPAQRSSRKVSPASLKRFFH